MLKVKPSIEEEMDFETEEPITLIVDDAHQDWQYQRNVIIYWGGEMDTPEKGVYQAAYNCRREIKEEGSSIIQDNKRQYTWHKKVSLVLW